MDDASLLGFAGTALAGFFAIMMLMAGLGEDLLTLLNKHAT